MLTILIATRNHHKVREIKAIYKQAILQIPMAIGVKRARDKGQDTRIKFISMGDFPNAPKVKENGRNYLVNAAKKALTIAQHTGYLTLGEDSGLEVKSLKWQPGIHSARYASSVRHKNADDIENNTKLLRKLRGLPLSKRIARYRSAVVIAHPQKGVIAQAEGVCWGRIALKPVGKNGFGYDPLFIPNAKCEMRNAKLVIPSRRDKFRNPQGVYPAEGGAIRNWTFGQLPISLKHRISHRARAIRKILPKIAGIKLQRIPR